MNITRHETALVLVICICLVSLLLPTKLEIITPTAVPSPYSVTVKNLFDVAELTMTPYFSPDKPSVTISLKGIDVQALLYYPNYAAGLIITIIICTLAVLPYKRKRE